MRAMTAEEIMASMLKALPPGAELTIVELPKVSVPAGELEFLLSGLEPAAPSARSIRVWRGSARYGETLRVPIWARVTVVRKYVAVIAAKDLPPNLPVDTVALRLETVSVPLDSPGLARRFEEVLGHVPRKPVRAGETIPLAILVTPPTVHKGDPIRVEVRSGLARLQFDAVAQGAANTGDFIELRNPESGRIFRAQLEEGKHAVVVVPSRQTL